MWRTSATVKGPNWAIGISKGALIKSKIDLKIKAWENPLGDYLRSHCEASRVNLIIWFRNLTLSITAKLVTTLAQLITSITLISPKLKLNPIKSQSITRNSIGIQ